MPANIVFCINDNFDYLLEEIRDINCYNTIDPVTGLPSVEYSSKESKNSSKKSGFRYRTIDVTNPFNNKKKSAIAETAQNWVNWF